MEKAAQRATIEDYLRSRVKTSGSLRHNVLLNESLRGDLDDMYKAVLRDYDIESAICSNGCWMLPIAELNTLFGEDSADYAMGELARVLRSRYGSSYWIDTSLQSLTVHPAISSVQKNAVSEMNEVAQKLSHEKDEMKRQETQMQELESECASTQADAEELSAAGELVQKAMDPKTGEEMKETFIPGNDEKVAELQKTVAEKRDAIEAQKKPIDEQQEKVAVLEEELAKKTRSCKMLMAILADAQKKQRAEEETRKRAEELAKKLTEEVAKNLAEKEEAKKRAEEEKRAKEEAKKRAKEEEAMKRVDDIREEKKMLDEVMAAMAAMETGTSARPAKLRRKPETRMQDAEDDDTLIESKLRTLGYGAPSAASREEIREQEMDTIIASLGLWGYIEPGTFDRLKAAVKTLGKDPESATLGDVWEQLSFELKTGVFNEILDYGKQLPPGITQLLATRDVSVLRSGDGVPAPSAPSGDELPSYINQYIKRPGDWCESRADALNALEDLEEYKYHPEVSRVWKQFSDRAQQP